MLKAIDTFHHTQSNSNLLAFFHKCDRRSGAYTSVITQFPGHAFRACEKLNLGYGKNKKNFSNNAGAVMRNDYPQLFRFWVTGL